MKWFAFSELTIFSAPICATNLIGVLINFFAMMIVASMGEAELAASALATSTYTTLMLVASTCLYAVGISISHLISQFEQNLGQIRLIFRNACWLSLMLSLPVSILLWNGHYFLAWIGEDARLVSLTVSYFKYSAIAIYPILLTIVFSQFFIGIGSPYFTLITSLLRLPFIMFFSYAFILGEMGLPQLGLGGVMAATLLVQTVYSVGLLIYLNFNQKFKKYELFKNFLNLELQGLKRLFSLGYPIGIQYGSELLVMTLMTYIMGYYGSAPLAASQIVSQYGLLVIMLLHGSGQGLSSLVSRAMGEQKIHQVKDFLNAALYLLAIIFICMMCFYLNPEVLVASFMSEGERITPELSYYAVGFFMISIISLTIDGVRIYISSVLRGLKQTHYPMMVGLGSLWLISLPVACLVSFTLNTGPIGLSAGFISGLVVASFLLWRKYRQIYNALVPPI
ncbi:MAG: MATE family efflux transporter [Gammaproteobacteria bacterium]